MISIIIEGLYIVYIIIAANSEIFEITVENVYLRTDFSILNLFILPVSVVVIIRTIIKFVYERKEIMCTLILLEIIMENDKINSQRQVRKQILKKKESNKKFQTYILKNFKEIINKLETYQPDPLIVKTNVYNVTKTGQELVRRYKNIPDYKYTETNEQYDLNKIEVWTEEDLDKIKLKREKSKNKKII